MMHAQQRLRIGLMSRGYPLHSDRVMAAHQTFSLAHALQRVGHEVHIFVQDATPLRHDSDGLAIHGVMPDILPLVPRVPMTDGMLRWGSAVTSRITELAGDKTVLDLVEASDFEIGATVVRRARLLPVVVRPSVTRVTDLLDGVPDDRAAGGRLADWLRATADGTIAATDPREIAATYARVLEQARPGFGDVLRQFVEEPVDLDDPACIRFTGAWRTPTDGSGPAVRIATEPGSAVHLTLPGDRSATVRFVGHPAAGVISLTGDVARTHRDLFRPDRRRVRWAIMPAGAPSRRRLDVTLRLEAIANPSARGCELWLEGVRLGS